jgi:alpha,alpha-trehalose-phosphate synthase [UDP-forming]
MADERFRFVVVSNRLPVDRVVAEDGSPAWKQSPGGLVTALEPVMRHADGAWVGWVGAPDVELPPFTHAGIRVVPVALTAADVEDFYEGFSNDTIWPLYHDVIVPATYHRQWWESYVAVNQRFADAAAAVADEGATVWVQDYQLQLVPRMLRLRRPDLTIGFFNHIPFPAYGLFSQLPWRTQIIEGLLGADVVGFQRVSDAGNFSRAVRRLLGYPTRSPYIEVPGDAELPARRVIARAFPISIDVAGFERLARTPEVQARATQIREELGNPKTVILGVDRLDYTKGIGHRLKAFAELLEDGRLTVDEVTLVQVASPSRERVETYRLLRDDIELTVGRINGDFGTIGHQAVNYLHHGFPREEMAALYLAADVMLVTALRDGMNLVAKEYVAARYDEDGVLVLSEFAGAADELKTSLRVNPHDIDGLKDAIMQAVEMPRAERRKRMRALRKRVRENDVAHWSRAFLDTLAEATDATERIGVDPDPLGDLEWTVDRPLNR